MYQAFPGGDGGREQPAGPVPPSIRRAVRLMYAGAVASIVAAGIEAAAVSWVKSRLQRMNTEFTTAQLTTFAHVFTGAAIAFGLLSAALWIWMAQGCQVTASP